MEKHISKLIPNADSLTGLGGFDDEPQPLNQKAVEIVNKIFVFFYGTCRGFEKQFQDPNKLKIEKAQWFRAFTDENFTDMRRINLGIKKCRLESPINTPTIGQFMAWCTPTPGDLGLLSKEQAFNRSAEFIRDGNLKDLSDEQNMLLEHSIRESDRYFMRNNPMTKTQPVFYRNYEIALRDFMTGKLQPIPKGLEDKHEETQELQKQQEIKKDFDNLKGYEQCMPEIRKMLEMNADGTTNTPVKRR
jgi:hypothetical protein